MDGYGSGKRVFRPYKQFILIWRNNHSDGLKPSASFCSLAGVIGITLILTISLITLTLFCWTHSNNRAEAASEKISEDIYTLDLTTIDHTLWEDVNVTSYTEYDVTVEVLYEGFVSLNVFLNDSKLWNCSYRLKNPSHIKSLSLVGEISPEIFLSILTQVSEIQVLNLNITSKKFCTEFRYTMPSAITISTLNLQKITLVGLDSCPDFYKFLSQNIQITRLLDFTLAEGKLDDRNIDFLHELMKKSSCFLKHIEISATKATSKTWYPDTSLPSVEHVKLNIIADSFFEKQKQSRDFASTFCRVFPNIQTYESKENTLVELAGILKCQQLKFLNITVSVLATEHWINLRMHYTSNSLRNVDLRLMIGTKRQQCATETFLRNLGLDEFLKSVETSRVNVISSSNCVIATRKINSVDTAEFYHVYHSQNKAIVI